MGTFRHFFARLGSSLERHALRQLMLVHALVHQLHGTRRSSSEKSSVPRGGDAPARSSYRASASELRAREQPIQEACTEAALTIVLARTYAPPCSNSDRYYHDPRKTHPLASVCFLLIGCPLVAAEILVNFTNNSNLVVACIHGFSQSVRDSNWSRISCNLWRRRS